MGAVVSAPRLKVLRRIGTPLPGLTRKEVRWKTYPPGAHGAGRQARKSDYRVRLEEKQKLRWYYGISERQLRSAFGRALRATGPTGESLLSLLERRLDNVVFRLGLAATIPAARQLVTHGHIRVDGSRVDRPGYRVATGEEIALSDRARAIPDVATALDRDPEVALPGYLALDPSDRGRGRVVSEPARDDVPFIVAESAIVEFYAR